MAKVGILAKLGLVFAKLWKVILIGIVALGAGIKNFFGGKKSEEKAA